MSSVNKRVRGASSHHFRSSHQSGLMASLAEDGHLIGSSPVLLEIKGVTQTAHLPTPGARLDGSAALIPTASW